jgi:hypothetical protein
MLTTKHYTLVLCEAIQVESGDSCAALATKCGITPTEFTKYNPGSSFCAKSIPKQHVCCSSGSLSDFSPKPNTIAHVMRTKSRLMTTVTTLLPNTVSPSKISRTSTRRPGAGMAASFWL